MEQGYKLVDGHQVYSFEWPNHGEPVVLLHGGMSQTLHWDYTILPAVESTHHVYAYDRSAHGYTGDRPGSLHYEHQRDEAIAYLETIVGKPAHLIGWSDGGIISLMVAIKRPDLVKSIIAFGANYLHSGVLSIPDSFIVISEEDQAEHNRISPDAPEQLLQNQLRMVEIIKSEPEIDIAELKKINIPTLIIVGDDDVINHHHTVEMYEALPQGQLAIVPATSHMVMKEKPELTQLLIREFLADLSHPQTTWPFRRSER